MVNSIFNGNRLHGIWLDRWFAIDAAATSHSPMSAIADGPTDVSRSWTA